MKVIKPSQSFRNLSNGKRKNYHYKHRDGIMHKKNVSEIRKVTAYHTATNRKWFPQKGISEEAILDIAYFPHSVDIKDAFADSSAIEPVNAAKRL